VNSTDARAIVRTLRQGVVSPQSVLAVSVGLEELRSTLDSRFSEFNAQGSSGDVIVVSGDWGAGKSHTAMLCQALLSGRSIPWIFGAIDGRENSLAHLNRCVGRWMDRIRIGPVCGLRAAFETDVLKLIEARKWALHHDSPLSKGLLRVSDGDSAGWLEATGKLCQMREGLRARVQALAVVRDVARMSNSLIGRGVVLILDEAENIAREWDVRGRRRGYEVLEQLAECQQIKLVLFTTSSFQQLLQADLERSRVEGNWSNEATRFLRRVLRTDPLTVPSLTDGMALDLVGRIREVYISSLGATANCEDTTLAHRVRAIWMQTATRSPRLLVRLAVNHLDLAFQHG
jgi:hypothetical protein